MESDFRVLRDDSIIEILIGDVSFGYYNLPDNGQEIKISMPYLTMAKIERIRTDLGISLSCMPEFSRKQRMYDLLNACIRKGRCSELLATLFSLKRFANQYPDWDESAYRMAHREIYSIMIDMINNELVLDDCKLVTDGFKQFRIDKRDTILNCPQVESEYGDIYELYQKACKNIDNGDYSDALQKAKSIIESSLKDALAHKGITPGSTESVDQLFKQVKDEYFISTGEKLDECIKKMMSGLHAIVHYVNELRNHYTDSHGDTSSPQKLEVHHVRLCLNASFTFAEYLLAIVENSKNTSREYDISAN